MEWQGQQGDRGRVMLGFPGARVQFWHQEPTLMFTVLRGTMC